MSIITTLASRIKGYYYYEKSIQGALFRETYDKRVDGDVIMRVKNRAKKKNEVKFNTRLCRQIKNKGKRERYRGLHCRIIAMIVRYCLYRSTELTKMNVDQHKNYKINIKL